MHRGRTPLLLLAACAALGGYIWFVERGRDLDDEGKEKAPPVFGVIDAASIDEIAVTSSKGTTTTLEKRDGVWRITAPIDAAVDEGEVSGITSNLASLAAARVVDEAPGDLAPYGLAPEKTRVAFRLGGATEPRTLVLGDKTATGGDIYARTADGPRVFLVSGFLDTTFDRTTFDLRDKTVLTFDRDQVDRLEIRDGEAVTVLRKAGQSWRIAAPIDARADAGQVESYLSRLRTGTMKSVESEPATDLAPFALDAPGASVTVGLGSSAATLALGKAAGAGSVYARDVGRPTVFTVDETLAGDLRKAVDEFRPRDLFAFRTFTASKVVVMRDGEPVTFERQKGAASDAAEHWAQTDPKADIKSETIGDALSTLSTLRADSFVAGLPAGATLAIAVTATFGDGQTEHVEILQAGGDYFATRKDEPGALELAAADVAALIKTLDTIK